MQVVIFYRKLKTVELKEAMFNLTDLRLMTDVGCSLLTTDYQLPYTEKRS